MVVMSSSCQHFRVSFEVVAGFPLNWTDPKHAVADQAVENLTPLFDIKDSETKKTKSSNAGAGRPAGKEADAAAKAKELLLNKLMGSKAQRLS